MWPLVWLAGCRAEAPGCDVPPPPLPARAVPVVAIEELDFDARTGTS